MKGADTVQTSFKPVFVFKTFTYLAAVLAVLAFRAPGAASITLELVSPNERNAGYFGYSVSGVPDANGDGWGEVIVGAIGERPGTSPSGSGRAYLFDGLTGSLLWTFVSPNEELNGNFGYSVSGIDDLNGDGRGDTIVGAPYEDPPGSNTDGGRAYVFSGATGARIWILVSPSEDASGNFGFSVSGVPDANGDGRGDVVVGAIGEDPGSSPTSAGRAYLFDGSTGGWLRTLVSPNEETSGNFGYSVSGIPDVNGDGFGDIVVGAKAEDPPPSLRDAGRAYIYSGATGSLLHVLMSPNDDSDGFFGWSVSGIPDVNGDGRGDVIVGAYGEEPPGSSTDVGHSYVFNGSTGNLIWTLASPNEETAGDFGYSVSGLDDVNGDDRGDVVVGAIGESPGGSPNDAGRAYVFGGADGELMKTLVSANEDSIGNFGWSVSGVPGHGESGLGNIVVGANNEDPGTSSQDSGRAYIFLSPSPTPSPTVNYDAEPDTPDGSIDARDLLHWVGAVKSGDSDTSLLLDLSRFWMGEWPPPKDGK
jgi:hypothetical protein